MRPTSPGGNGGIPTEKCTFLGACSFIPAQGKKGKGLLESPRRRPPRPNAEAEGHLPARRRRSLQSKEKASGTHALVRYSPFHPQGDILLQNISHTPGHGGGYALFVVPVVPRVGAISLQAMELVQEAPTHN